VRRQIAPAVAEAAALAREDQLGADAVGRGGEEAPVTERLEPGEGAEALPAGGRHGGGEAPDDSVSDRERDTGVGVALRAPRHRC